MADDIKSYRLTLPEQEIIAQTGRDMTNVDIYCSDRVYMRKLDSLCVQFPETYNVTREDPQIIGDGLPVSRTYSFPKKYLRFGKPPTEAQRSKAKSLAALRMQNSGVSGTIQRESEDE